MKKIERQNKNLLTWCVAILVVFFLFLFLFLYFFLPLYLREKISPECLKWTVMSGYIFGRIYSDMPDPKTKKESDRRKKR